MKGEIKLSDVEVLEILRRRFRFPLRLKTIQVKNKADISEDSFNGITLGIVDFHSKSEGG